MNNVQYGVIDNRSAFQRLSIVAMLFLFTEKFRFEFRVLRMTSEFPLLDFRVLENKAVRYRTGRSSICIRMEAFRFR